MEEEETITIITATIPSLIRLRDEKESCLRDGVCETCPIQNLRPTYFPVSLMILDIVYDVTLWHWLIVTQSHLFSLAENNAKTTRHWIKKISDVPQKQFISCNLQIVLDWDTGDCSAHGRTGALNGFFRVLERLICELMHCILARFSDQSFFFWSLPSLTILFWRTLLVITKHPENELGIAKMDNTTTRLITF